MAFTAGYVFLPLGKNPYELVGDHLCNGLLQTCKVTGEKQVL